MTGATNTYFFGSNHGMDTLNIGGDANTLSQVTIAYDANAMGQVEVSTDGDVLTFTSNDKYRIDLTGNTNVVFVQVDNAAIAALG